MTDATEPPYADEAALWSRLAALLPFPEDVAEVRDCWDIGEQEAGLTVLVRRIRELGLPLGGVERAEIAVMARQWGVWDRLGADIVKCPGDPGQPTLLRVLDAEDVIPGRSVVPDHPSSELLLVPWITCTGCGRVPARGHEREWWGDLSYLPRLYAVFAPDRSVAPQVFDHEERDAAWRALTALRAGCVRSGPNGVSA
ncbi:hypothetical protein ACIPSA_11160 [Streptomyces sp. NPDC086549]|uniref:hypothetical protein n=1 Tax=Streptomyces sp. NPDC086549 TaxID=3365752 RepID=UPI0038109D38